MTDSLQNGKLVADIVKRDFQIMSRRIHASISATIRTVFTRSSSIGLTTHVSSSDPRLEHHRSPSGTRKVKASADSLHGAEYVECRRSSRCRSCLTNWSIIMYDHETQGLQIVLDAWTNIGACKVPYSVAWSCASRGYGKICRYLPADGVELRYPQYILDGLYVGSSVVSDR